MANSYSKSKFHHYCKRDAKTTIFFCLSALYTDIHGWNITTSVKMLFRNRVLSRNHLIQMLLHHIRAFSILQVKIASPCIPRHIRLVLENFPYMYPHSGILLNFI